MESDFAAAHCPKDRISALLKAVEIDARGGVCDLETLLDQYPSDERLHFLKGLLKADEQDYNGARASMRSAIDLAPNYHVARFQLGFLLLAAGEPHSAQEVWGPLHSLPTDNYLYIFVQGLCRLINGDFSQTVKFLEDGIARNREKPIMNRDMQMVVD